MKLVAKLWPKTLSSRNKEFLNDQILIVTLDTLSSLAFEPWLTSDVQLNLTGMLVLIMPPYYFHCIKQCLDDKK